MAAASEALEDYSLYSNLSDDELLQLAIERSLTDTPPSQPAARNYSSHNAPADYSSHNAPAAKTTAQAHYSSPNPPSEEPSDPKSFDGMVSHFMTGSGKHMYRRADGSLVLIAPEPEEEEEPLFKAIRVGDAISVEALAMRLETNLVLPNKPGWLAIHQAVWFGQDTCLQVLLSAQPGMINKRTKRGESALLIAVSKDQLRCVQVLLEKGADPNIPNYDKETPLYRACERSIPAMVALLLNHGAAVNAAGVWGCTALHEAACRSNLRVCELLLRGGAKHDLANEYGLCPLFTAAQSGQLEPLRLLLQHGADINAQAADGATALYEAAKNGHEEIVELLLSQNANANKCVKTGLLPLHAAAQKGSDIIVSMLIPATSKTRVRQTGISPLHLAAEHNHEDVLEVLIEAGFDVNAQLSEERSRLYLDRRSTALYFSVANNNTDAVHMLLEAGADPNLDVFGPLLVAARQGRIQTVTLLVEHGAHINASIPTHPTTFPAVYLFSMKNLPMFKYLLDHGGHALSCFNCVFGNRPHPPIKSSRSETDLHQTGQVPQKRGVQYLSLGGANH
ncbi:ankyrin repeat and SOCS box protein 2-like isoform X2 [Clinocottus analis]|uniref:ankyrin repeat and SOCS box protein 2-like isoform X2 n=1 Tax=Clinocottus analis TaxID=304258 RepID=UPI0035C0AAE6